MGPDTGMTRRIRERAEDALQGRTRGWKALYPFLGPAFVAAVAYVDPGNYATNIQAGATFGYRLLWVIVFANLMAMLMQTLSSKLGIATGKNLAEMCGERFPKAWAYVAWIGAEIAAMATDVAEFLGATLGLNLLFGIPLLYGALITGVVTYVILMLENRGFRQLEATIAGMILVIAACYLVETILSHPAAGPVVLGSVTPWIGNTDAALLAVGIIGATVMPHALHFHSAVSRTHPTRPARERSGMAALGRQSGARASKSSRSAARSVAVAMALAGLANVAIVLIAARLPKGAADGLPAVFDSLGEVAGRSAALLFGFALLISGLASTVVGVYTGQIVMEGFLGRSVSMVVRRGVGVVPAMAVLVAGLDATRALVLSQVVLSFALPATLIPLLRFTRDPSIMGRLVNRRRTSALAAAATCLVVTLDAFLLWNLVAP